MVSQMTHDQCKAELKSLLGESMRCAETLQEILAVERDALERKETVALDTAATRKQLCIKKLEELETARGAISAACGFGNGPHDMPALAEWCDEESMIADKWEQFIEVVRNCNDLNSTNGAIINVRHQQTKDALSLLRSGDLDSDIYGPRGLAAGTFGSHSLAEV